MDSRARHVPGASPDALPDRVRRAYDARAAEYETRWARYLRETIGPTLHSLDPVAGETILDLGCGTGQLLREACARTGGVEAWGVDLSPEMLRIAEREWGGVAGFVQGDAVSLSFPDDSFDAVVCTSVAHHWPDPLRVLQEIARVTRPGGRLVITDWCADVLAFRPLALRLRLFDPTVARIYRRDDLEEILRSAGFEIIGGSTYRVARWWGMMTVVARLPSPAAGRGVT